MNLRVAIYYSCQSSQTGTERELRETVEGRGDIVVSTYTGCPPDIRGRRRSGWKTLLAGLDGIQQIVVQSAGDLPGKKIYDLLTFLARLRDHGVSLYLNAEDIDTSTGTTSTVLEIAKAFRLAKLSAAIKRGQVKARKAGKRIGRPKIPGSVRRRILAALIDGAGVRATARRFNISPASVVNVKRTMSMNVVKAEAA